MIKTNVMASKFTDPPPHDTEARKWWELALERHDQIWQLQRALVDERQTSPKMHQFMWLVIGMFVQSLLFLAVRQPGSIF